MEGNFISCNQNQISIMFNAYISLHKDIYAFLPNWYHSSNKCWCQPVASKWIIDFSLNKWPLSTSGFSLQQVCLFFNLRHFSFCLFSPPLTQCTQNGWEIESCRRNKNKKVPAGVGRKWITMLSNCIFVHEFARHKLYFIIF